MKVISLFLVSFALTAAAAPKPFLERLASDQPFYIAHRGRVIAEKGIRENTVASFEEAGKEGLQAIETDVCLRAGVRSRRILPGVMCAERREKDAGNTCLADVPEAVHTPAHIVVDVPPGAAR